MAIGGKVVAVGKGKVLENGDTRTLEVKVGQRVLFEKYAGTETALAGSPVRHLKY
ncbi:hypothetical protein ACFLU6_05065 [Acidobacteriota bacterium]